MGKMQSFAALTIAGGVLFCSCSMPELDVGTEDSSTALGGLRFEPGPNIDFGEVTIGDTDAVLQRGIKIKNRGLNPITINRVSSSCSCSFLDLPLPVRLAPGEHCVAQIRLGIAKSRSSGLTRQAIVLHTDDPEREKYVVQAMALVNSPERLKFFPDYIDFGKVGSWQTIEREVRLEHLRAKSVQIESLASSIPHVTAQPAGRNDAGAAVFKVRLASDAGTGVFSGQIDVMTSVGNASLAFKGETIDSLIPVDKTIIFRQGESRKLQKQLVIMHAPKQIFEDVAAESDLGICSVRDVIRLSEEKSALDVNLELANEQKLPARGTIVIIPERNRNKAVTIQCFVLE